jgi:hypothetical protein
VKTQHMMSRSKPWVGTVLSYALFGAVFLAAGMLSDPRNAFFIALVGAGILYLRELKAAPRASGARNAASTPKR